MGDLTWLDATAQAELVRRREVCPSDLVEASIRRIERVDPSLNAVVTRLFDEARKAARARDLPHGPFRGVPFLLKHMGASQVGLPRHEGNGLLRDIGWRCRADTALGARYRAAGLVVVGVTNMPEFGLKADTQPLAFGPTRNPWDLTRSVSGSSGGAAAAVAAGMVALAAGGDYGGSLRTPASWCGLVGLKPSRGRTSAGQDVSRNSAEHVLTRSVRDTAALLDAVHGPAPGDLFLLPPPARPYASELTAERGRLRIGLVTEVDATDISVHPACVAAARSAAGDLETLGHVVEPARLPALCSDLFIRNRRTIAKGRIGAKLRWIERTVGRPLTPDDVEPDTWALAEQGWSAPAADYAAAEEWQQAYAMDLTSAWTAAGWDLLLTPATGEPPVRLEALGASSDPAAAYRSWQIACFAAPFNATGQPAVSLPLAWTPDGLPLGVQLVAAIGREDLLIRVASQLEQARPWADRRPPGFG